METKQEVNKFVDGVVVENMFRFEIFKMARQIHTVHNFVLMSIYRRRFLKVKQAVVTI